MTILNISFSCRSICRFSMKGSCNAPCPLPSILKQIVEPFLAIVFGFRLRCDTARTFDYDTHLEETAEVVLLFVDDVSLDRFFALKSASGLKMSATPATPHISQTVRTTIRTRHTADKTGRATTIPT
ncbi:MAG: hypothetical protein U9R56_03220 [candidate division Zixibacteria bacterium]|nr:hypothetical protein [candidate division Zixibacteria bacterium]